MFEWLLDEIAAIQTPKFHIIDGPADTELSNAIFNSHLHVPESYREFVLSFGNARLYRQSRCGYMVGVFAGPRSAKPGELASMYQIGFNDGQAIYLGCDGGGWAIFQGGRGPARKVAEGFDEWLEASCEVARDKYSPEQWEQVLNGPRPFSDDEERIIATRKRFEWQVLEVDESGDRIIAVRNCGYCSLPALTVGVRSNDGRLNGAVQLSVGHVMPGEGAILHAPCYKDLFLPRETELFSLPDPQPEDRAYYAEFSGV